MTDLVAHPSGRRKRAMGLKERRFPGLLMLTYSHPCEAEASVQFKSILRAFHISAVSGFDHDAGSRRNMRRNHRTEAVRQDRRFERRRCRLVFNRRFGFGDFKGDAGREFDGDWAVVKQGDLAFHAFLQEGCAITQHVGGYVDLFETFGVHENVLFAVLIEIGVGDGFDEGAFHVVGGLEADDGFHAVGNAAHVDCCGWCALAGMHGFGLQNDI
jgi:hypothetical protein